MILHDLLITKGVATIEMATIGKLSKDTEWKEKFYTYRDSFRINDGAPTKTDTFVDQMKTPIDTAYEVGDFNIEFMIPDTAKEIIDLLHSEIEQFDTLMDGYKGVGFKREEKAIHTMLRVHFESGQILILPKTQLISSIAGDDLNNTPLGFNCQVSLLGKLKKDWEDMDFILLNKEGAVEARGVTSTKPKA